MKKLSAIVVLFALSLGSTVHAQQNCEPSGGLNFICGLTNAEDLVAVPGTQWIIASGMAEGASISLIDSRTKTWRKLYPGERPRAAFDRATFSRCPGAPTSLITHGLSPLVGLVRF